MFNSIRPRIEKTREFVREHQTLVACAATAVVTAKLVRDSDVKSLKAIATHYLADEGERFAYLMDATSFIDSKGMTQEFHNFAPRLRD